jgi:hypothetical protein
MVGTRAVLVGDRHLHKPVQMFLRIPLDRAIAVIDVGPGALGALCRKILPCLGRVAGKIERKKPAFDQRDIRRRRIFFVGAIRRGIRRNRRLTFGSGRRISPQGQRRNQWYGEA